MKLLLAALAACAALGATAQAATLAATPATFDAVLVAAKPGDVLKLGAGEYVGLKVARREFSPPLVIDATLAVGGRPAVQLVRALVLESAGVTIKGGLGSPRCTPNTNCYEAALRVTNSRDVVVDGFMALGPESAEPGQPAVRGDGYGFMASGGSRVSLLNSTFSGFRTTAVFNKVDTFRVVNNRFSRMRSDGLNIAQSWNGVVEYNYCDGTRIMGAEHPDCIQAWSRADAKPTGNLAIRYNVMVTDAQGVFLGNHTRTYNAGYVLADGTKLPVATSLDDGGFDNVEVRGNTVAGAYPNGLGLYAVRGLVVRDNTIITLPNAPYEVRIVTTGSTVTQRCGNTTGVRLGRPPVREAACP